MSSGQIVYADDDYIRNVLLNNGALLQEFPILTSFRNSLQQFDKQCQSCTGKAAAIEKKSELFNTIRQSLSNFPPDYKARLLAGLGVSKLRTPYYVVGTDKRRTIFHGTV